MSQKTKIQWCDSTINPTMGCSGCELFPSPARVIEEIDAAVSALLKSTETSAPPLGDFRPSESTLKRLK